MKIAVYHNLHSGGAKRTLTAITQKLVTRHHVDIYDLTCSDHSFTNLSELGDRNYSYRFAPLREFRKPFGRLNFGARWIDLFRLEYLQRRIAKDIDERGYDVAYVHPCQFTQSPALLSYLQTPALYHSREHLRAAYEPIIRRPYRVRSTTKQFLDRIDAVRIGYERKRVDIDRLAVRAILVVTNSRFTCETLYRTYGVNARVCYHGVDTDIYRPLTLPRNGTVLSVGALTPNKGFDFIIQSLARIPIAGRPNLTIISNYQEPQEKLYLENLARRSEVTVQFLQMVSDDLLVRAYNEAQLVVYAPILEPFGLVPLEAMACGTPVVAVAEGGVRESIVSERTGLLVERDPACFAEAVESLITNPTLASNYGRNARAYVTQKWTWDKAVASLENHLSDCVTLGRHGTVLDRVWPAK